MASLAASLLAGLAAVISSMDHDANLVPFFVGLTVLGGINTWAVREPYGGMRLRIAIGTALLWAFAAAWVTVLLVMSVTVWQASGPPPSPEDTYAGLTATMYRVVGMFGGGALVLGATFVPERWVRRDREPAVG